MNTARDREVERVCPECGATLPGAAQVCWLCGRGTQAGVVEGASPFGPVKRRSPIQFGIASLLLLITLWAVVLSVFSISPGIGIALVILGAPAVIRTVIVAMRSRAGGQRMSMGRKIWVFTGTLGLLAVIGVAVSVAFVITCFPLGLAAFGTESVSIMVVAWVVGVAAGLAVLYVLFRVFRRRWPRGN